MSAGGPLVMIFGLLLKRHLLSLPQHPRAPSFGSCPSDTATGDTLRSYYPSRQVHLGFQLHRCFSISFGLGPHSLVDPSLTTDHPLLGAITPPCRLLVTYSHWSPTPRSPHPRRCPGCVIISHCRVSYRIFRKGGETI